MPVYPTSVAVELGLGGIYRDTLIDDEFVAGCWPLSELASDTAFDIGPEGNHGTYTGTGFTRGVTGDMPEGNLGVGLDGNGYILVLNDGTGGPRNLSLAGGAMMLAGRFKTSTADATLRCIIQKQETDSNGNGYHVAMQSGALEFRLRVAGSNVFSFQRGSGLANNAWHTFVCIFDRDNSLAYIFVDGVQLGAASATTATDPAVTSADLRIGTFSDGAGDFIGSLSYVICSREANLFLPAALDAALDWTAVTTDVRETDRIVIDQGPQGSSLVADRVAPTGTCSFTLDNSAQNSARLLGYYTLGHANCRTGFELGIPAKVTVTYGGTPYIQFRGRVIAAEPVPGVTQGRGTLVTCGDWHHVAALTAMSALEAEALIRSDQALALVADQAQGRTPAAVDLDLGASTFPFCFDISHGDQDAILTELSRILESERGYLYVTRDGTWRFESRATRQMTTTLDVTLNNRMQSLDVRMAMDAIVNIVRVTVQPRRLGPLPLVLYELDHSEQAVPIAPDQTRVLEGAYRDPDQVVARVGGTDMIHPVLGTDYGFWSAAGGSGTDLGAELDVFTELGGSSFRITLTNTGASAGYLYLSPEKAFQIRGVPVYYYDPITIERRVETSIRRYGPRTITLDLPYETSVDFAEDVANYLLNQLSDLERPSPAVVGFSANDSATLMVAALSLDPGAKIGIIEPVAAQITDHPSSDATIGWYINGRHLEVGPWPSIRCTWDLVPTAPEGAWILDQVGASGTR